MEVRNFGDQITAYSNGAIMEVNLRTGNVGVYGSHPSTYDVKGFNSILRDLNIDQRIVYKASCDNCLRVIPLKDMI